MSTENDLEELDSSYIDNVLELSRMEELVLDKDKEIQLLRKQIKILQSINNTLLGIKQPLVNNITPQSIDDLKTIQ